MHSNQLFKATSYLQNTHRGTNLDNIIWNFIAVKERHSCSFQRSQLLGISVVIHNILCSLCIKATVRWFLCQDTSPTSLYQPDKKSIFLVQVHSCRLKSSINSEYPTMKIKIHWIACYPSPTKKYRNPLCPYSLTICCHSSPVVISKNATHLLNPSLFF